MYVCECWCMSECKIFNWSKYFMKKYLVAKFDTLCSLSVSHWCKCSSDSLNSFFNSQLGCCSSLIVPKLLLWDCLWLKKALQLKCPLRIQHHLCWYSTAVVSLQNIMNVKESVVELHLRMAFALERNERLHVFFRSCVLSEHVFWIGIECTEDLPGFYL